MSQVNILWADDEIDLLKPHILFLQEKGYEVQPVSNGFDALEAVKQSNFDAVLLDENMPGYSGLDTLGEIKKIKPSLPVIMITKSEEEQIMEQAIGSKISDYLIKPVNPKQILLSLKKNLQDKKLIQETSAQSYQQEFRKIAMQMNGRLDLQGWCDIYKQLSYWSIELDAASNDLKQILNNQMKEANVLFSKYVDQNYADWLSGSSEESSLMSHTLLKEKYFSNLTNQTSFLLVIDNLRYDQWLVLKPLMQQYFTVDQEGIYSSILPTATHYARNSLFAGLLPSEIEKIYPDLWLSEEDEGSKNKHEHDLFNRLLKRTGKQLKTSYAKVLNSSFGKKVNDNFHQMLNNDINVVVYNFIDMLSHATTDTRLVKELAESDAAYRSVVQTWFEHSTLKELLIAIADSKKQVFITTDHGTIQVDEPVKVIGDKHTNTNLRYKVGKNLSFNEKEVYLVDHPSEIFLPKANVSSKYIFAKDTGFFAYPNNFNHYVKYYQNTFQHGGISMQEMLIPFALLSAK